jgi:hypothetical protein
MPAGAAYRSATEAGSTAGLITHGCREFAWPSTAYRGLGRFPSLNEFFVHGAGVTFRNPPRASGLTNNDRLRIHSLWMSAADDR